VSIAPSFSRRRLIIDSQPPYNSPFQQHRYRNLQPISFTQLVFTLNLSPKKCHGGAMSAMSRQEKIADIIAKLGDRLLRESDRIPTAELAATLLQECGSSSVALGKFADHLRIQFPRFTVSGNGTEKGGPLYPAQCAYNALAYHFRSDKGI